MYKNAQRNRNAAAARQHLVQVAVLRLVVGLAIAVKAFDFVQQPADRPAADRAALAVAACCLIAASHAQAIDLEQAADAIEIRIGVGGQLEHRTAPGRRRARPAISLPNSGSPSNCDMAERMLARGSARRVPAAACDARARPVDSPGNSKSRPRCRGNRDLPTSADWQSGRRKRARRCEPMVPEEPRHFRHVEHGFRRASVGLCEMRPNRYDTAVEASADCRRCQCRLRMAAGRVAVEPSLAASAPTGRSVRSPSNVGRRPSVEERISMSEFRIERDSMGEVRVPAQAYYGAQTQRAEENFPDLRLAAAAGADPRPGPGEVRRRRRQSRPGQAHRQRQEPARPPSRSKPCWPPAAKWPTASSTTSFPSTCFRPARARRAT